MGMNEMSLANVNDRAEVYLLRTFCPFRQGRRLFNLFASSGLKSCISKVHINIDETHCSFFFKKTNPCFLAKQHVTVSGNEKKKWTESCQNISEKPCDI